MASSNAQYIDGRKVVGGEMILHVDGDTDLIISIDSNFLPGTGLPRAASVPGDEAILNAVTYDLAGTNSSFILEPDLVFLRSAKGKGYLAWQARVNYTAPDGSPRLDDVFVDAVSGEYIERHPRLHNALFREVFDTVNSIEIGPLLISEGGTTSDPQAQNAYNFSGDAYDYFWFRFFRDSWDGMGVKMKSLVHLGSINNAFWSVDIAKFGDGDGIIAGPSSDALDIVAHEFTHGVTQSEADLVYSHESGALNEAMADIFGASVEMRVTGVTSNSWKIGEDWVTPGISGDALRYMDDPEADGESKDYYPDIADPAAVHQNNGVANLAFYLLSQGGTHPRGETTNQVSGIGNEKADRIFYLALRDKLLMNDGFNDARNKTALVAQERYGVNSNEYLQTCEAWDAVGVPNDSSVCTGVVNPLPPPGNVWDSSGECYGYFQVRWTKIIGATRYEAYMSSSLAVPGILVYSGTKRSAILYAPSGTPFDYVRVKACDATSCSILSSAYAALWRQNTCY